MEISDALRQEVRALLRGSISYRYSGGKEQDTRVRVTFTDDFLCQRQKEFQQFIEEAKFPYIKVCLKAPITKL